jgi:tRNA threonylcarbamoyladenosine biosynthesis protein TsaB
MMLLALDTSTAQTGLALYNGVQLIGEQCWTSRLRQTVELAPAIMDLLRRVEIPIEEIKAIGVAIGPGSFTSLRVGLSLAKGLALARHIPLIGIPSLNILAAALPVQLIPLAAILQAGRGRLAVGWYHAENAAWLADGPVIVQSMDELAESITTPTLVCGELTGEERQRLVRKHRNVNLYSPAGCVRRPGLLAELAWQRWQAGDVDPAAALAPIYLRVAGGPPI